MTALRAIPAIPVLSMSSTPDRETCSRLQTLIAGAVKVSGMEPYLLHSRALAVLGEMDWRDVPFRFRSGLNYDSSPLQVVFTAVSEHSGMRLLGDPNSGLINADKRYRASLKAMERVVDLAGSESIETLLRRTLEMNLPKSHSEMHLYPDGVMWLGAALGVPGCAMYVDARRGGPEAALARLERWLQDLCSDTRPVKDLIQALRTRTLLMCLGIEGSNYSNARAKIYWRLEGPAKLKEIGIPGVAETCFAEFLSLVMAKRQLRLSGIVFNAGIRIAGGEWADVKLDVCGCRHCLNYSPQETVTMMERLSSHFGLAQLPVSDMLKHGEFAFCGLGMNLLGQLRLNVYFKVHPKGMAS